MKLFKIQYDASAAVIWATDEKDLKETLAIRNEPFVIEDDILYYEWQGDTKETVEITEMIPVRGNIALKYSH